MAASSGDRDRDRDRGDKGDKKDCVDKEDDRVWVQCDLCQKWRALPPSVDQTLLPEQAWTCDMNIYDKYNSCEIPEETYEAKDIKVMNFFKHWTKRLNNSFKYTQLLERPPFGSEAFLTRSRKRLTEVEWIRCCNPSCGKWRAIMSGLNSSGVISRLNKSKWSDNKNSVWYCSMNSWDDTTASCSAPQEPLYDVPWNLGLTK